MEFEEVKKAVRAATESRTEITCHEARQLAHDLGVEYSVVGRACDKMGIGMRHCQWSPWCVCEPSVDRKRKAKVAPPGPNGGA